MKRGFVAAAGAVIVVAGMVGCSSNKACSGSTCASVGKGSAKVTIDGKDQNIQGTVSCETSAQATQISLGNQGDPNTAMGAQITGNDVQQVALVLNGQKLVYQKGNTMTGGDATLNKDGSKYTITGKAAAVGAMPDMSNPTAPIPTHDFTMEVTCP
ncbi:MAG: lipoprotein LpqH [Mycobacteriaceae bacterium]|nr:lipoprotein LpqH [Mycobacteriaceae bacterium]MBV9512795.1 lipoprotein LpqH [Mycobacteriaceae bacterium]